MFRNYIIGTHFKVVIDHNGLKALVHKATFEGKLAHYAVNLLVLILKSFTVVVKKILLLTH